VEPRFLTWNESIKIPRQKAKIKIQDLLNLMASGIRKRKTRGREMKLPSKSKNKKGITKIILF